MSAEGESTIFHAINRGKRPVEIDLEGPDRARLGGLIAGAGVVLQDFRPGVIERLGFGYDAVAAIDPRVVHGSITGHGRGNDRDALPGRDLLAQARSGVMWLSGGADDGPVAIGLPVGDTMAGAAIAQGVLALLLRRERTGRGGHVETSLMEALLDLQLELVTTRLADGRRPPRRARANPAHACLAAPYGAHATADGHVALGMNDLARLAEAVGMGGFDGLDPLRDREAIGARLGARLANGPTERWMEAARAADLWAAPALGWNGAMRSGMPQSLDMLQAVPPGGAEPTTTAAPMRLDGARPKRPTPAPRLGADDRLLDEGWPER